MASAATENVTRRRRSARIASCSSRWVSGAISLMGRGSISGGVPGMATPLAEDDAPPNQGMGSVFGARARETGVDAFVSAPGELGEEEGGDALASGLSKGVAAAVRVAAFPAPGALPGEDAT